MGTGRECVQHCEVWARLQRGRIVRHAIERRRMLSRCCPDWLMCFCRLWLTGELLHPDVAHIRYIAHFLRTSASFGFSLLLLSFILFWGNGVNSIFKSSSSYFHSTEFPFFEGTTAVFLKYRRKPSFFGAQSTWSDENEVKEQDNLVQSRSTSIFKCSFVLKLVKIQIFFAAIPPSPLKIDCFSSLIWIRSFPISKRYCVPSLVDFFII